MKRELPKLLCFVCAAILWTPVLAQTTIKPNAPTEAGKIVQALTAAYVSAFDRADASALAALYAPDAQYTSELGETLEGRNAIEAALREALGGAKGVKLSIEIASARLLTPDVLVANGTTSLSRADLVESVTRTEVMWVKKNGQWLIAQAGDQPLSGPDAAAQALDQLAWLVGSWKDNLPGAAVDTRVEWTRNTSFLRRSFTVANDGAEPIEATEVIGFDPSAGTVRSWLFDSQGGFGENVWTQDGNKWLISARATLPSGKLSSAQHVLTRIDDGKFTWETGSRVVDGEALPNLDKVEVVRAKEK